MRLPGVMPSVISALAMRLVRISNSAKLVWRPSNSNAVALPRLFARARTISARFAGSSETDMFLPGDLFFVAAILTLSRAKDNTGAGPRDFTARRPCESRDPYAAASRLGAVAVAFANNKHRWLWVPAFAATTALTPRGLVLFVLRLDRIARCRPVGVRPVAQLIKIAAHGERLGAVHRDGLAVDPVAAAGNQEHGEVLQFFHLADAAHRVQCLGAGAGFVAGFYAFAHALGRNFAGRDRVQPDAVASPFGRKRHGHGVDRGFAHRRGHHIGAAVAHPRHRDRHHVAGLLGGDPAPAHRVRYVERAVHHDVWRRVKTARRQVLGARDKIAGGVVDEVGERAVAKNRLDHLVDRKRVSDIDAMAGDPAAIEVHQLGRGLVADDLASAADMDFGAELEEARRHRFA